MHGLCQKIEIAIKGDAVVRLALFRDHVPGVVPDRVLARFGPEDQDPVPVIEADIKMCITKTKTLAVQTTVCLETQIVAIQERLQQDCLLVIWQRTKFQGRRSLTYL